MQGQDFSKVYYKKANDNPYKTSTLYMYRCKQWALQLKALEISSMPSQQRNEQVGAVERIFHHSVLQSSFVFLKMIIGNMPSLNPLKLALPARDTS